VVLHRAAVCMPYAVALLNLLAAFTGGTQGQALLTAPVDAPVPKLSTGGSYGHSRLLPSSFVLCASTRCLDTVPHSGCPTDLRGRDNRRYGWPLSAKPLSAIMVLGEHVEGAARRTRRARR
jgi:hypothetical protein